MVSMHFLFFPAYLV